MRNLRNALEDRIASPQISGAILGESCSVDAPRLAGQKTRCILQANLARAAPVSRLAQTSSNFHDRCDSTRGIAGCLRLALAQSPSVSLDEAKQTTLEDEPPIAYDERDELAWAIGIVASMSRKDAARELGISVRRLQDIVKGRSKLRARLRAATIQLARYANRLTEASASDWLSSKRAHRL